MNFLEIISKFIKTHKRKKKYCFDISKNIGEYKKNERRGGLVGVLGGFKKYDPITFDHVKNTCAFGPKI